MRAATASHGAAVSGNMPPRRRTLHQARHARRAVAAAAQPTPGQVARGHGGKGADGWKAAGWDMSAKTLSPDLQTLLLTYGELVQAGYDNLEWNECSTQYGSTMTPAAQAPASMLSYLTNQYSLVPSKYVPGKEVEAPAQGTKDKYLLPDAPGLSPIIRALPGEGKPPKLTPAQPGQFLPWLWRNRSRLLDFAVYTSGGIAVKALFDKRALFVESERTGGRGVEARSAFMAYVAMSQPSDAGEVDVVFVWRGTIFREEWANNFAFDRLAKWDPDTWAALDASGDGPPTPAPWEVGVHAGFKDLYLRPCSQEEGVLEADLPPAEEKAPRQVVHDWLRYLMSNYNVTTICTSGHSLGGAMCTLCAFDIAEEVARIFASDEPAKGGWKTQAKPAVTSFAWASPRVGNYSFLKEFSDTLGARNLRICNRKDPVPSVPGVWVQLLTWFSSKLGHNVYADLDSWTGRGFAWLYYAASSLFARLGFESKWGYTHVGQILEIDSSKEQLGDKVADSAPVAAPNPHNLELHLYLLSKLATGKTYRNFFLLNKTDAFVGDPKSDPTHPANWWRAAGRRGMALDGDGRWDFLPQKSSPAGGAQAKGRPKKGTKVQA